MTDKVKAAIEKREKAKAKPAKTDKKQVALKGGRELRRRVRAIPEAFKPIGRNWADDTVRLARPRVPVRTGRLRQSIRRRNANKKRATVVAHYTAFFVDKGTKAHDIKARRAKGLVFEGRGGRTIFASKVRHRGYAGRPFREQAAREALARNPAAEEIIRAWNRAAQMGFRADVRAAAVTMLTDYAESAGVRLQVYPARPRSISPPTAFVDLIREDRNFTGLLVQRTPTVEVVVLHGLFDSKDSVEQGDAFTDGFLEWCDAHYHAAGASTLIGAVSTEDIPAFVPDWLPPEQQRTYYGTQVNLEGLALD